MSRSNRMRSVTVILISLSFLVIISLSIATLFSCAGGVNVADIDKYTLTIIDDGRGSTIPFGAVEVTHGVPVTITATPDDEFGHFNPDSADGDAWRGRFIMGTHHRGRYFNTTQKLSQGVAWCYGGSGGNRPDHLCIDYHARVSLRTPRNMGYY